MSLRLSSFLPRFALALPLVLGACAMPLLPQAGAPAAPATAAAPAPGQPAAAAPKASAPRQAKLEGPAPETLIGSDQNGVLKLVGAPGLVRHERGVDVWQYAEDACVLLMYFYDDKDGTRKLTYLEAMPKAAGDAESVSTATCLSDQIRAFKAKDLG